jgi:anti-anti-sigma factor
MNIQVNKNGTNYGLAIEGEIDECGAEVLKTRFREITSSGSRSIVVDFSRVTHIGSAGIGKILVFYKDLAIRDATLSLVNVPDTIFFMFREMKLDTIFNSTSKSDSQ